MKVSIEEVRRLKARLREINSIPFESIEWVDDNGNKTEVHPGDIDLWRFTGLNNVDFVELVIDGQNDSQGRAIRQAD